MMIADANWSTIYKIKRTPHFLCSEFELFVALLSTPLKVNKIHIESNYNSNDDVF